MAELTIANDKAEAGNDPPGFRKSVLAAQLNLLVPKRAELVFHLIAAGMVAVTFWRLYPAWILVSWLGLFSLTMLARWRLDYRFRRTAPPPDKAWRWGRLFALGALATGCLWGLTASVILVTTAQFDRLFIALVLSGVMVSTMIGNAAYPPAMFSFLPPTVVPAIVLLLTRPDLRGVEMGVMLVLYAAVLTNAGRRISRSTIGHIRMRIRRDDLVTKLLASQAAMVEAQALARVGSWDFDVVTGKSIWSAEMFDIFGLDASSTEPSHAATLARTHPDDRAAVEAAYADWFVTGEDIPQDHRIVMDNGANKWVHAFCRTLRDEQGHPVRLMGVVQDVTSRKESEDRLEFANLLLKTLMDASPAAVLLTDTNHRIVSFNERFSVIMGGPPGHLSDEQLDSILLDMVKFTKDPKYIADTIRSVDEHPIDNINNDFETRDGRTIHTYSTPVHAPSGAPLGRAWFFTDITGQKHALARALKLARTDTLTGLENRLAFAEILERAIGAARTGGAAFTVMFVDLDRFKDVNDTFGYAVGDELLKAVADRLRFNTSRDDAVARFGADEFAIMFVGLDDETAGTARANRLIKIIEEPFVHKGAAIHTSASIGLKIYGRKTGDAETLLADAGIALGRAKSEGRGACCFFTDAMDVQVRSRLTLSAELRNAIPDEQLFLVYQPQVRLADGRITGVEALVRWRHPDHGLIGPDVFIPLAERMDLIGQLGHWVMWTACRQAKSWLDEGVAPLRMCVNLSAMQFRGPPALEADIAAALAQTGLPPSSLELELTESVLMNGSHDNVELIARLRKSGVTIAIDDFGTGYSSLDYLRRFPVDRIKIGQNFVKHLQTMPGDAAIVKATIGLARDLGAMVIAEGIETRAQFDLLKGWGCPEGQGYLLAKPLEAEAIRSLLLNNPQGPLISNIRAAATPIRAGR